MYSHLLSDRLSEIDILRDKLDKSELENKSLSSKLFAAEHTITSLSYEKVLLDQANAALARRIETESDHRLPDLELSLLKSRIDQLENHSQVHVALQRKFLSDMDEHVELSLLRHRERLLLGALDRINRQYLHEQSTANGLLRAYLEHRH
jgi:hypothetical protein